MASQPIYQFYAELKDYKPLIWRRFQVAGNITLAQLGYVTMTLFEMKGSHLFHLEYSVNENMPDDDPAYQSEPDKILRYDIAGGDSFPETMISNPRTIKNCLGWNPSKISGIPLVTPFFFAANSISTT